MDSDRFGHLRQGWNIYAFDDMAAGLSVEASFIDMGLKKGFSLVVTDLARKEAAVLYASPAKPMEAMPSSPGDAAFGFYNDEMTLSFSRRGSRHRLLFTAPYLRLPSGEKGIKGDMLFLAGGESACHEAQADSRHGIRMTASGPMPAEGVLFIEHMRRDIREAKADMSWGSGRFTAFPAWSCAYASWLDGDVPAMLLICGSRGYISYGGEKAALGGIVMADGSLRDSTGALSLAYSAAAPARIAMHRSSFIREAAAFSGIIRLPSGKEARLDGTNGVIKHAER